MKERSSTRLPAPWRHFQAAWLLRLGAIAGTAACTGAPARTHAPAAVLTPAAALAAEDTVSVRLTSRFRKVVLDDAITRAHALDVAADGRVFFAEREGAVKVWDPRFRRTRMVGFVPVEAIHTSGLLGIALDPAFSDNGWVYLYYSPHSDTENLLARFTIEKDRLVPESRKVLLEVPVQRHVAGGHSAGSLAFGPGGVLYLSTGDNTNPQGTRFAPIDERPGREIFDAQRTSSNTFDLRGKILRIRPMPDGSYEIPPGNLFPYGALGRPEIFVMGARNPFRIAVDPSTGWVYWGDVGPDAGVAEAGRGPAGYDEFNQTREAGNFGWPYFVADNRAYHDFDFEAEQPGPAFQVEMPINESVNNTGARVLPPAQPALIWYPYGASPEFPVLGVGGRAAMAGPLYRSGGRGAAGPGGLPAAFDESLFVFDFMRSWIQEVRLGPDGEMLRMERFLPEMEFVRPMAMDVGPDGALYLIEWGENYEGWHNDSARLVRLEYVGPNGDAAGASAAPSPSLAARGAAAVSGGGISFLWPVHGGVFDFDEPIPYRVAVAAGGAIGEDVRVTPSLGHDSHTHALQAQRGARGDLRIRRDETHFYLEDHFAVLEAAPAALENEQGGSARIVLQPRRLQAEHAATLQGATREVRGSLRTRVDVQLFLRARDGDYASYPPIDLINIDSLAFRVSPGAGGIIEIRRGGADGPVLARATVDAAPPAAPPSAAESAAAGRPEEHWAEVVVPVSDPGGAQELFLVFRGAAGQPLLRLDWIEFRGPGVMQGPR